MPLAAFVRLCIKDSAWVGAFARRARSSASSASEMVSLEYWLLLAFLVLNSLFLFDLLQFVVDNISRL